MNKIISIFVLVSLVLQPFVFAKANAVKQDQKDNKDKNSKPKPLNRQTGEKGVLNESKSAMISVDPLALQNYSEANDNFDIDNYDKVTLKSVILETLSQSNTLKSAAEKVNQIELELKKTYAAYHPTVDFEYTLKNTKNHTGDTNLDTPSHSEYDDEAYKLTLKQSLYAGGATALKVKSIKSKVEEGKRKYLIVLEQEIQKAIKAYFQVLFNHQKVQLNQKNMDKLNKILDITQVKYDSGALAIGDLSAVKANIANASSNLISIKSELADSLDYYLYIVGEDFTRTAPFEENFSIKLQTLDELYKQIEEKNLGLLNYRLNIQSTKDNLLSVKAKFKPKVDLEMYYKNVLDKEEFSTNEESYVTKLTLAYNLYNGGKDTIDTMRIFSDLQELKYRYKEQIKKIKWEVSKLYNSIKSLDDTIKSTKEEVRASQEMVGAYWEGFQLGEQDLQVLLQGQRQLNSAQLNLVKFKQDYLTNLFKLIKEKGELASYFDIDPEDPHFIDFSNTAKMKKAVSIDLTTDTNTTRIKDLNKSIDEYLDVPKEATFDDIINFRDKFLQSDDEKYTLVVSDFKNYYDSYQFLKKNRLLENGFSYGYYDQNGTIINKKTKEKTVSISNKIAYGIFETKEDASNAKNNIFELANNKTYTPVQIKAVKEAYKKYIDGLETTIQPYIIKPKIIKTFVTDQNFKSKFLNAPEYYYTINVVSVSKLSHAAKIVNAEGIKAESFVFKYGLNGEWIKIMYGVYPTYTQAYNALTKHPNLIDTYQPVIEKINHKQELYKKYKKYNNLPKWYIDEQKEKAKQEESKKLMEDLNSSTEDLMPEIKAVLPENIKENNTSVDINSTQENNTTDKEAQIIKELDTSIIDDFNSTAEDTKEKNATSVDLNNSIKTLPELAKPITKNEFAKKQNNQYTITLFKSYPNKVEDFIQKHPKISNYYLASNNNVAQVISGFYDTREDALKALNSLNEELKKNAFLSKVSTIKRKYKISKINLEDKKDTHSLEKKEMIKKDQAKFKFTTQNSFSKKFQKTDTNKYTIYVDKSLNSKIKDFADTYFLDSQYTSIATSTKSSIILYGIYDSIKEAQYFLENEFHPKIAQKAYPIQIKDIK